MVAMGQAKYIGDFSVLMPTYDREDLLRMFGSAVESIYSNSLLPKQVIIVVDGPVGYDFSKRIREYEDRFNFEIIWLNERSGITKALNEGLERVTSKWTFRADGDDINMNYRFEEQFSILQKGYDLVGGWAKEIDSTGLLLGTRKVPETDEQIRKYIRYRNPFNHMTTAYSTERARKIGGYPDIYLREDYGMWASLIRDGAKSYNIQKVLVHASAGSGQYARRSGQVYLVAEYTLQKHLVRMNQSSPMMALVIGLLRALIFGSPRFMHSAIYRLFLRSYS